MIIIHISSFFTFKLQALVENARYMHCCIYFVYNVLLVESRCYLQTSWDYYYHDKRADQTLDVKIHNFNSHASFHFAKQLKDIYKGKHLIIDYGFEPLGGKAQW